MHKFFAEPFTRGTLVGTPADLKKNQVAGTKFQGAEIWIGRTGYTGEDGFEIIAPADVIEAIWDESLKIGAAFGLQPAGLGARDTLRTKCATHFTAMNWMKIPHRSRLGLGFSSAWIRVSLMAGQFWNGKRKAGPERNWWRSK
jgi:aminomethyltransferase